MTIKPGQYFMKMKCSGTVYSGQGERRGGGDAKLLSCGVFLYPRCILQGGQRRRRLPGASSHAVDQDDTHRRATLFKIPKNSPHKKSPVCSSWLDKKILTGFYGKVQIDRINILLNLWCKRCVYLAPVNKETMASVPLLQSWPSTFWWSSGRLCCWRPSRLRGSEEKRDGRIRIMT